MATKTFSSRADSAKLAYADSVTRSQFNMSFGQYCGSVLVEAISQGVPLPNALGESAQERKANAAAKIKSVAKSFMEKNSAAVSKGYAVTREEDVAEALRRLKYDCLEFLVLGNYKSSPLAL